MFERFIALLAPLQCLGCGRDGAAVCPACMQLARLDVQQCFGCGTVTVWGEACAGCAAQYSLRGVAVAGHYDGALRQLVLQLKFRRLRSAVNVAADLMTPLVFALAPDVITSVPIAPSRYRERGYNQSALLAQAVSRRAGLPYRQLLWRQGATHQLGLGRAGRLATIQGQFMPARRLQGQRVLVVDDVVTTGATLEECTRVLMAAGAGEVWGLALARR